MLQSFSKETRPAISRTSKRDALAQTFSSCSASNNKRKLLPHITEQYTYRITNRLLLRNIMRPKRDKTIADSLTHTALKKTNKHKNSLAQSNINLNFSQSRIWQKGGKKTTKTSRILINVSNLNYEHQKNLDLKKEKDKTESCSSISQENQQNLDLFDQDNRKTPSTIIRQRQPGKILKNNFINKQKYWFSTNQNSDNNTIKASNELTIDENNQWRSQSRLKEQFIAKSELKRIINSSTVSEGPQRSENKKRKQIYRNGE